MFDTIGFQRKLFISFGILLLFVFGAIALVVYASKINGIYSSRISVSIRQKAISADALRIMYDVRDKQMANTETVTEIERLSKLLTKWENAQRGLLNGSALYGAESQNSVKVQELLLLASTPFVAMRDELHVAIEEEGGVRRVNFDEMGGYLDAYTDQMDLVTGQFISESTQSFRSLVIASFALAGIALLAFFIIYRKVLRPSADRIIEVADELQQMESDLQRANQVKTEFMANMSNEIRTPLNGVIGMAEVLSSTDLKVDQREFVRSIQSNAINLLDLVNDILDYSQIESGKLEIHRQRFVLSDCFDQVVDIMKPLANQKSIELISDIDPNLPIELVHDERRIRQIILNLVNNAVKFTDYGEIVLKAELINKESDFVQIKVSVRDTGIGIDSAKTPFLFRSFSQADSSVSKKYGGSGLGLAICKSLITEMGGKIWVESIPRKGSAFFFTLVAETSGESQQAKLEGLSGMKAVVVDDNKTNLKILVKHLSNWGVQATPFNSPDLVNEIIPDLRKFDFCILDMQMPEMDGAMLAKRIRASHSMEEFPIILLSSIGQHLVDSSGNLFNAYLTKPVRQSRLLDVIADVMKIGALPNQSNSETGRFEGGFSNSHLKVLIAHDNELTRAVTEKTLQLMGYQFEVAHSGEEILEQSRREEFDLIILDVDLPEMSGIETIKRMKKIAGKNDMPVVIGITSNEESDKKVCIQAGMTDLVSRPLSTDELQKRIHYWLDEPVES